MKIFVFLISSLISLDRMNGQIYDLSDENITGKVKTLIESHYSASEIFGEVTVDSMKYMSIYKFNNSGKVEELSMYGSDGKILNRYTFEYENGNRVSEKQYSSTGELVVERKSNYDKHNNQIEENIFYYIPQLSIKYTYEYDVKGNQIKATNYNLNGTVEDQWSFEYDSNGNRIKVTFNGTIITHFKYDDKGRLIETKDYKGNIVTYKYANFEKNGNWRKQTVYENTISTEVIEREFTFY